MELVSCIKTTRRRMGNCSTPPVSVHGSEEQDLGLMGLVADQQHEHLVP